MRILNWYTIVCCPVEYVLAIDAYLNVQVWCLRALQVTQSELPYNFQGVAHISPLTALQVRCEFSAGETICQRCLAGNHDCVARSRKKRKAAPSVS